VILEDQKWAEWRELQDSGELKALIDLANKKVEQICANVAKGKGKGKDAGR
jgi:hypothetical protein